MVNGRRRTAMSTTREMLRFNRMTISSHEETETRLEKQNKKTECEKQKEHVAGEDEERPEKTRNAGEDEERRRRN